MASETGTEEAPRRLGVGLVKAPSETRVPGTEGASDVRVTSSPASPQDGELETRSADSPREAKAAERTGEAAKAASTGEADIADG